MDENEIFRIEFEKPGVPIRSKRKKQKGMELEETADRVVADTLFLDNGISSEDEDTTLLLGEEE